MDSYPILSHLCAAEFMPGDSAYLVAWTDGHYGILRNGQPVGGERWQRADLAQCAQAFLNYVRLARKHVLREREMATALNVA